MVVLCLIVFIVFKHTEYDILNITANWTPLWIIWIKFYTELTESKFREKDCLLTNKGLHERSFNTSPYIYTHYLKYILITLSSWNWWSLFQSRNICHKQDSKNMPIVHSVYWFAFSIIPKIFYHVLSGVETDVLLPQQLRGNVGAYLKSQNSLHVTKYRI